MYGSVSTYKMIHQNYIANYSVTVSESNRVLRISQWGRNM
jgi:hypothetical protein